jgi:DNA repair exonuclease SbcCD ATPase subunit
LDSRYSDAASSGEQDEVAEGEAAVDNIIETGMAQDRGSPLLYTGRCMTGEIEAIKLERDALKREAEELRDQCRGAWALKQHVDKVTEERDALILEAERKAKITENIMEERDALRLEAEELRAQREEGRKLEDQLNFLIQKSKDIGEERDALMSKAQNKAVNNNNLNIFRVALKHETQNIIAQRKATALLEEQLNFVRLQCNDIAEERDSFKLRYRCSEADCNAIRKLRESLKDEIEKLRPQLKDYALLKEKLNSEILLCEDIAKERDSCKLKYQRSYNNSKVIRKVMEALKYETEEIRATFKNSALLEKELNTARQQCENIKKERNVYKLRAQRIAESRNDIKIERDALKLETENLRAKIKHTDLLENQIKAVMLQCNNIKTEIDLNKLKSPIESKE